MKSKSTEKTQEKKKSSIGFFSRSKKKASLFYKIGGRFVTENAYLKHTGVSKTELEFAKQSIISPLQNKNGFLKKSQKDITKDLINDFLNNADLHPKKYVIYIYATSERSFASLQDKKLSINDNEVTYNELRYFFAKLLDTLGGGHRVFYFRVPVKIDEIKGTAKITVTIQDIQQKQKNENKSKKGR